MVAFTAAKRLAPKEAAALLELSPSTLSKWRTRSEGPPWHRRGKRLVHYFEAEIVAWLASCDPVASRDVVPCDTE